MNKVKIANNHSQKMILKMILSIILKKKTTKIQIKKKIS